MDYVRIFTSKYLTSDTRAGRAVRTGLQVAIAALGFVYGLLTLPGFGEYLVQNQVVGAATFTVWTGVVSYVYNAVEALIKYLND